MDPLNAFKNEVFRPIASIVLPGMLAIIPFVIVLGNSVHEVKKLYEGQPIIFFILFLAASTIAGMLLENIGMSIERGIDRCMEVEYLPGADEVWEAYLAIDCTESNAKKYLGTLVTRLKFINSMIPAVLAFAAGLVILNVQLSRWHGAGFVLLILIMLVLVVWLFRTATELSEASLFARWKMLPRSTIDLDTAANTVSRFRHLAYVLTELRTSRVNEIDFKDLSSTSLIKHVGALMLVAVPADSILRKPKKP